MSDIVQKLWGFCHTLRHDGIDYGDYIEQITYLLFLKMADERALKMPKACDWTALREKSGTDLTDSYADLLRTLGKESGLIGEIYAGAQSRFANPVNLKRLVSLIDETEWTALGVNVKAQAYEGLLEKAASEGKKGAGQYFTPRPLIKSIVRVMKPDPRGKRDFAISDPACGTGEFLVSAYEWLMAQTKDGALDRDTAKRVKKDVYFGQELVARPRRLALMNLVLHGLEPHIKLGDSIYEVPDGRRFDVVLTNPPFGTKGANQAPDRDDFTVSTSNKQLNFVQHIMTILKPGGRAAVVLPDNLQRRGLGDAEIDGRQYRTLAVQGRAALARELRERFGDSVLRVPGFFMRNRDGRRYLTLAGAAGLLIPVRDVTGRIVAVKIRRDESDDGRYSFLSSANHGGPGSGAPVHVPAGIQSPAEIVRLTEGELKADVAFVRSGLPTISMPGVSSWRVCLSVLKALGCKIVRLAIDADAKDKPAVARALDACAETLATEGFAVELERWPAENKGIDDALAVGAAVEVLAGDAARQAIAEIVAEGTAGEPPQEAGPLDRWDETLAAGAESLFRDRELLRALAKLSEADPAEFNCRRAQARTAGIRLRELDAVLSPMRREIRAANPPPTAAGEYRISAGRIAHLRPTPQGVAEVPLGNFQARIAETVTRDDGAETSAVFAIEGALADGRPLPRVTVKASEFPMLNWITAAWQGRAIVFAGTGTRDHLRCGIEMLSPNRVERVE